MKLRNFDDLSLAEQYEVLNGIKNLLTVTLLEEIHAGTIQRDRIPATVKHQLATHQPVAVNWNEAPTAAAELSAVSVLEEAERIIAGCCPCCGSSNVQSSTMGGRRLYDCQDCGHSWEG